MLSEMKFSLLAIIFVIATSSISTAIPYWVTADDTTQGMIFYDYMGLWKACSEADGDSACLTLTDVKDFVSATRGLMITGIILFGISLLLALKFAADESSKTSANTCILLLVLGSVLLITAMIVFGDNYDVPNLSYNYGSAFYLPIPSAIFAFVAAGFVFKAKRAAHGHGYETI